MQRLVTLLLLFLTAPTMAQIYIPDDTTTETFQIFGTDIDDLVFRPGETFEFAIWLDSCPDGGATSDKSGLGPVFVALDWDPDQLECLSYALDVTLPGPPTGFIDNLTGTATISPNGNFSVSGVCSDPPRLFAIAEFRVRTTATLGNEEINVDNSNWNGFQRLSVERFRIDYEYLRGDTNGNGIYEVADGSAIVNYLFNSQPLINCLETYDINNDEVVDLPDAIQFLNWLFSVAPATPPAPPINQCGYNDTTGGAFQAPQPLTMGGPSCLNCP